MRVCMHFLNILIRNEILEYSLGKIKPWNDHKSDQIGPDVFVKGQLAQVEMECISVLNDE